MVKVVYTTLKTRYKPISASEIERSSKPSFASLSLMLHGGTM
jgi:hypothetical protein